MHKQDVEEIEELRARLEEAEEALRAIRSGEVDALVVSGPEGEKIYTLVGAERTYRILVEAMNEGALVLSPEGAIIYSNRTFAAMLGAPLGDVIGASIYDFVVESDVEPLKKLLQQALLSVGRKEINLKHTQTGSVPASLSVGNIETTEGPSISAVVMDLTEHKRTEAELEKYREHLEEIVMERTRDLAEANDQLQINTQELAQSRAEAEGKAAQLESFISSMVEGVTLLDADGNVVMMNDAGKAMLGIPPDAPYDDWPRYQRYTMEGQPIPLDDFASFRALRGETVRNTRYKVISPWGKELIISASSSPVRDGEGRVIGATNVFHDISSEVEFEHRRQELFEKEHHISEMLQQVLIPSHVPYNMYGISIATRYQAALEEARVGGDFYDIFELGEGKIGVLIGDVAGKGLQAAIRVAAARHSIRSYAYLDLSPGKVMTLVNAALIREDTDPSNLLTAFFAIVDAPNGTITYSSAGHEPPVVCNVDKNIEELQVTGAMLGVIEDAEYSERVYKLRSGDSVVMFTDGITEARRDSSDFFDKEGIIKHLMRCCDAPPEDIASALLEAATLYAGGSLQDDAAIVVLGYR